MQVSFSHGLGTSYLQFPGFGIKLTYDHDREKGVTHVQIKSFPPSALPHTLSCSFSHACLYKLVPLPHSRPTVSPLSTTYGQFLHHPRSVPPSYGFSLHLTVAPSTTCGQSHHHPRSVPPSTYGLSPITYDRSLHRQPPAVHPFPTVHPFSTHGRSPRPPTLCNPPPTLHSSTTHCLWRLFYSPSTIRRPFTTNDTSPTRHHPPTTLTGDHTSPLPLPIFNCSPAALPLPIYQYSSLTPSISGH